MHNKIRIEVSVITIPHTLCANFFINYLKIKSYFYYKYTSTNNIIMIHKYYTNFVTKSKLKTNKKISFYTVYFFSNNLSLCLYIINNNTNNVIRSILVLFHGTEKFKIKKNAQYFSCFIVILCQFYSIYLHFMYGNIGFA